MEFSTEPGEVVQEQNRKPPLVTFFLGLLPLLFMLVIGLYGIDFGYHWDEEILLEEVQRSLLSGIFLPETFYNYPSLSYWLTFGSSGLDLFSVIKEASSSAADFVGGSPLGIRPLLVAHVVEKTNLLRTRSIFLVISSLVVVWVYILQLVLKRNRMEALLASLILGLSWEVNYPLRWIAPDGLLMQFGALTLLFVTLAHLKPEKGQFWLRLAAIAAGLGCGSKYPGGLLIVPVLIAVVQLNGFISRRRGLIIKLIEVIAIFGFTYLIVTPGTVLVPVEFARDVFYERVHYQTGHLGHNVTPGWEHLKLNLEFFALVFFSRYALISLVFFLFSLVGIYAIYRDSRQIWLLFISFPLLYIMIVSIQQVMIVRNLLVLTPFWALFSARGIAFIWELLSSNSSRLVMGIGVSLLLAVNAVWLIHASETIHNRNSERFVVQAVDYINKNPELQFFASEMVAADIINVSGEQLKNVSVDPLESASMALFYGSEGLEMEDWPATNRKLFITWFGPYEINLNYYPNWQGDDRILLMDMSLARELHIQALD